MLDSIGELRDQGAEPGLAATAAQEIEGAAQAAGIAVPSELAAPETTSIFRSLQAEMGLAVSVVNGTYGATYLHTAEVSDDHWVPSRA